MLKNTIIAALWSLSPFGEAKVGIPYAIIKDVNIYLALIVCLLANILIFPLMHSFLKSANTYFFKWRWYRRPAVLVGQRTKRLTKNSVKKYGFWGLMVFVMTPLPGTGVYAGTIASYILGIDKKKAFWANSIGITLSSIIVWTITVFADRGISMNKVEENYTLLSDLGLLSIFGL